MDEAYRLGQGHFAQEAIDELVDSITKPQFAGKLVIILAGYDEDMNNLLRANEGLGSRFADEISFPSLGPAHCLQLLQDRLTQRQIAFPSMQDPIVYQELLEAIGELSKLPSWGNARDTQTLAKGMIRAVYQNTTAKVNYLQLPADTALSCIRNMLAERHARARITPSAPPSALGLVQSLNDFQSVPRTSSTPSTITKAAVPVAKEADNISETTEPLDTTGEERDAGVADAVWQQLQNDKQEVERQIERAAQEIEEQREAHRLAEEAEKEAEHAAAELRKVRAQNEAEALELLRMREEARVREMEAKAERERVRQELERRKRAEEERRQKEELAQRKLRQMGVCVAGFKWIKQSGGYRCAGGSHWVGDSQLGM